MATEGQVRSAAFCTALGLILSSLVLTSARSDPREQWRTIECQPVSAPTRRIERLREWVAAVERHRAGTVDDAAQRVRGWFAADIELAHLDARSVVILMRKPATSAFFLDVGEPQPRRPPQITYTSAEVESLRALACDLARRSTPNRVLMRGALLHTDIGTTEQARQKPRVGGSNPRLIVPRYYLEDGRLIGVTRAVSEWALARTLLDLVSDPRDDGRRDPARHPAVRLWYQASLAFMHRTEYMEQPHFGRALQLFPSDADILTLVGAYHETLAMPRVGRGLRAERSAIGLRLISEGSELREAEKLYRRALAADPRHGEARLRRGRVLGLLGRSAEALDELARATSGDLDPTMRYYADIFLAREALVLGRRREARAAYEHAASLFPGAQTPQLGLSHLSHAEGDRAEAIDRLRRVLAGPDGGNVSDDPRWTYAVSAGRRTEALLEAAYARFPASLNGD